MCKIKHTHTHTRTQPPGSPPKQHSRCKSKPNEVGKVAKPSLKCPGWSHHLSTLEAISKNPTAAR